MAYHPMAVSSAGQAATTAHQDAIAGDWAIAVDKSRYMTTILEKEGS
jgi:hypothetical protein